MVDIVLDPECPWVDAARLYLSRRALVRVWPDSFVALRHLRTDPPDVLLFNPSDPETFRLIPASRQGQVCLVSVTDIQALVPSGAQFLRKTGFSISRLRDALKGLLQHWEKQDTGTRTTRAHPRRVHPSQRKLTASS